MKGLGLIFLGDLFFDYDNLPSDIRSIGEWIHTKEYISIVNLESPLEKTKRKIVKRGPCLYSNKITLDVLRILNTKVVCLANNHIMDYGEEGLMNTISILNENSFISVGAGNNLEEAIELKTITVDDNIIGFLNFAWDVEEAVYANDRSAGCAPRKCSIIMEQIHYAKQKTDKLVIVMHWGFEFNRYPQPYDIDLAHQMIDAGADLIVGGHSHCIQSKEKYHGKWIYYSLGNFYFSSRRDGFKQKYPETIYNQCDYGLALIVNSELTNIEEKIIYYDSAKKETRIIDLEEGLLNDISGIDYLSEDYLKKVKKSKININPVLTTDKEKNYIKIKFLYTFYDLKNTAKKWIKGRM